MFMSRNTAKWNYNHVMISSLLIAENFVSILLDNAQKMFLCII